ncbi:hypothetical protein ACFL22_00650 [Patescibacteria group bacterium]
MKKERIMNYMIKEGGSNLHLLVSGDNRTTDNLNIEPIKDDEIIHFLHVQDVVEENHLQFTMMSFDLKSNDLHGPYPCGTWNRHLPQYDVSDIVHTHSFCNRFRQLDVEHKLVFLNMACTQFIPGLQSGLWRLVWDKLNTARNEQIERRLLTEPRKDGEVFKDDVFDKVLVKVVKRVSAIMNTILYRRCKMATFLGFHGS